MNPKPFHGSYAPQDVIFLLKVLDHVDNLPLPEKEHAIQTGARHYSEMLTPENLPSPEYFAFFTRALQRHGAKMAQDCQTLAHLIARAVPEPILISLARAGTPVGVVVKHLIARQKHCPVAAIPHYSVSIIRDRGIDHNALRHILRTHGGRGENFVFIDGWTGKGVITRELQRAVAQFNAAENTAIPADLYVLSDLAGVAHCSASYDDYLIPSGILNATVSGLVSRSVLNAQIGGDDFHGCLFYRDFLPADQSRSLVQTLLLHATNTPPAPPPANAKTQQRAKMAQLMAEECQRYGIRDVNLLKPGVNEATRVLLRRLPERVVVANPYADAVAHLIALAREKNVPITVRPDLPLAALAIIRSAT